MAFGTIYIILGSLLMSHIKAKSCLGFDTNCILCQRCQAFEQTFPAIISSFTVPHTIYLET